MFKKLCFWKKEKHESSVRSTGPGLVDAYAYIDQVSNEQGLLVGLIVEMLTKEVRAAEENVLELLKTKWNKDGDSVEPFHVEEKKVTIPGHGIFNLRTEFKVKDFKSDSLTFCFSLKGSELIPLTNVQLGRRARPILSPELNEEGWFYKEGKDGVKLTVRSYRAGK